MSILEIVLYIGLSLITLIIVVKTIIKGVKLHKAKKQGKNIEDEDIRNDQDMQSK